MIPFVGSDFRLQSVAPIGLATLRVRFTQDPSLSEGATGALNIDNYTITGPALNYVVGATQVIDDPQAVDLFVAAALELGEWTLAVDAGVVDENGDPLEAPISLAFTVTQTAVEEGVPRGAVNDAVVNVLRKHFNPALKGKNWDSILAALATGDKTNWDNGKLAFDQLFIPSASGVYLDRRAGDQGVRRPPAIAMPDDLFRDLAIISKTRKLTQDAILETLEVFYGSDAVRAFVATRIAQPFALEHLDDLRLLIDERDEFTIIFDRGQFARIGVATATEVAVSISRQLRAAGSAAYAVAHQTETGDQLVRVYSGRLGISSAVRVLGGKAQTRLGFLVGDETDDPDFIFPSVGSAPFADWDITASPDTIGNWRFTLNSASATFDDFNKLVEGDRALIYGQEFLAANRGTWEIKLVGVEYPGPVQWFEIENPAGVAQAGVSQDFYASLQFHRPKKKTIYNEARHVLVSQSEGRVDVVIPATTQAVRRGARIAAYGNLPAGLEVSGLVRGYDLDLGGDHVLGTTAAPHGLAVGDMLLVETAFPLLLEDGDIEVVPGSPAGTDPD